MSAEVAEKHDVELQKAYATAKLLAQSGDEWSAVCYFYAAYRAARSALNRDARLDSDSAARAIHHSLTATSRHVDFHNGHPKRGPGLNDVVRRLYPAIAPKYEFLHAKSVEVRYESGLVGVTVEQVATIADEVIAELKAT